MNKRRFSAIITLLICIVLLCACSGNKDNDNSADNSNKDTHSHDWSDWKVTKIASCKEKGQKTRSCDCGEKETEAISKLAHTDGEWVVDTPATNAAEGKRSLKCSVCGETIKTESIPKIEHSVGLTYKIVEDDPSTIKISGLGTCKDKIVIIPETIDGLKVVGIGVSAFASKSIEGIIIPDTVTVIHQKAFQNCTSLKSVVLPDSVTRIDQYAFSKCKALEEITLPSGLTYVEIYLFQDCTNLKKVNFPDTVTSIRRYAFENCSLSETTFPNTITSLAEGAFQRCTFSEIILPENITSIPGKCFYGCQNLQRITIPNNVSTIGANAFNSCVKLSDVTLPENLQSLSGQQTFGGCTSLTQIIIPNGITSISGDVFNGCYDLKTIYYIGTEQEWSKVKESIVYHPYMAYYAEEMPAEKPSKYWHFVNNVPTKWS